MSSSEQWKEKTPAEQQRLLEHPWEFQDFAMQLNLRSELFQGHSNHPRPQKAALLHLVFPDIFEAIVSVSHKDSITKAFSKFVKVPEEDVDRQLQQIRPALESEYGSRDHFFYRPEIRAQWDPKYKPDLWGDYVRRAKDYVASGRLESEEIEYKVEIGRKLVKVREAVLAHADGWADLLKRALDPKDANFITWRLAHSLNQWCVGHPDEALRALQVIWAQDYTSVPEKVRSFCRLLPDSVTNSPGNRTNVASCLLMGLDVEQYPPFRVRVFNETYARTGYDRPEQGADEAALYEHALGFLDRLIDESKERGLQLRHRLDAQSVIWAIQQSRDEGLEEGEDQPHPNPWAPSSIEALAKDFLWEPDHLQKIIDGLKDKRQAIFQGPPGTGKTYVAKRIAEWSREHGGDFQIVQFHPSYSYEDFVEGFRPTLSDAGHAGFSLTKGPLRRIAEKAEANPDSTFILVIDEINRGNVAKVLGELYFLLEYRNEKVALQYSGEEFSLPENLWFIGTMNTTDRSIALVDAALRRRFYFFGFFPDEPPVQGLLGRWLEENDPEAQWVSGLVDSANRKLADRHLGIGPSHFMKKDLPLDGKRVQFIWEQAVIPYIEEQCFGNEEKLKEFAYGRLMQEQGTASPGPDAGSGPPEGLDDGGNGRAEDDGAGDASD